MTCDLLLWLGITPNYRGFHLILDALEILQAHPGAPLLLTKEVYPRIAKQRRMSSQAVERDIRTAISRAWSREPAAFAALFSPYAKKKPTASQLLALLAEITR